MNREQLKTYSPCFGGFGKGCLWTHCAIEEDCRVTTEAIKNASVEELPEYLTSPLRERHTARERYNELKEDEE